MKMRACFPNHHQVLTDQESETEALGVAPPPRTAVLFLAQALLLSSGEAALVEMPPLQSANQLLHMVQEGSPKPKILGSSGALPHSNHQKDLLPSLALLTITERRNKLLQLQWQLLTNFYQEDAGALGIEAPRPGVGNLQPRGYMWTL